MASSTYAIPLKPPPVPLKPKMKRGLRERGIQGPVIADESKLSNSSCEPPPLPEKTKVYSNYISDLEGLDLTPSESGSLASMKKGLSSSMEDLAQTSIYPDISGAFHELRDQTVVSTPLNNNMPMPMPMPMFNFSYNTLWHPPTFQTWKHVSAPYPIYVPLQSPGCLTDLSSSDKCGSYGLPRPASLNDLSDMDSSVSHVYPKITSKVSEDLIDFSDRNEKTYLSLEDFDPLRERARRESMSSRDPLSIYSIAKPFQGAELSKSKSEEETAHDCALLQVWANSGSSHDEVSSDNYLCQEVLVVKLPEVKNLNTYNNNCSVPSLLRNNVADTSRTETSARPTSWTHSRKEATYEKLQRRKHKDEESQEFCQMVADLKAKYKSSDCSTNLGFIVSPVCGFGHDPMSIKVVIHSCLVSEAVRFTCDITILVEHVISQVIYASTECLSCGCQSSDFILKVFDRSEYLLNHLPLSRYEYVHNCLKLDHDIQFQMMRRQDIPSSLLRTVDDDKDVIYYPKDYIQIGQAEVSRESLDILMEIFYKEVEKLCDHALQGEVVQSKSLQQSVKAICSILEKLETIEVTNTFQRVESIINKLTVNNKAGVGDSPTDAYSCPTDSSAHNSLAFKCSLLENLQDGLEELIIAVKNLVNLYCRIFQTDFLLNSSKEHEKEEQDVTSALDNFIVNIATAHRIPLSWTNNYEEYRVDCSLYHGGKQLSRGVSTLSKGLSNSGICQRILWNEWLHFDFMSLCSLPRETRLCMTLKGTKRNVQGAASNAGETTHKNFMVLGEATIQLFNFRYQLVQGSQLIPLQVGFAADPLGPTSIAVHSDTVFLQINLPDFGKRIVFCEPHVTLPSPKCSFDQLSSTDQEILRGFLEKDAVKKCTPDEYSILWSQRRHLMDNSAFLPWVIRAAPSWDWASLPEIYCLLGQWSPLQPTQALELLLASYPDIRVRGCAVKCLRNLAMDELIDYLPQLIQALKFDSYHNSPLAQLLLEKSCQSIQFAHKFFWLLKGAAQDTLCKRRYELMFVALANVAGEALYQEFHKQEDLVKMLSTMAENVKEARDKDLTLKRKLESLYEFFQDVGKVHLPFNPSREVCGIDIKSCSYFTSNTFPLKLIFKNINEKADSVYTMFKVGDDLRQDMLTLQMIRIMDKLWLQDNLDLKIITFACLSTGPKEGIVELVTESETLRKIQGSHGLTGSFKDRPLSEWLQKHNPTQLEYDKAVENFTSSCAGYCVATYVLGICDRHNDNIMVKQSGHLFHIDFGKFLGDAQMFGNFKRDRVPFVLTSDMLYVINGGDKSSSCYQRFVDMCCSAFNIIRKNGNLFLILFSLMSRSGIPGVSQMAVRYIQQALLPGKSDAEAAAIFTRMIEESSSSVFTPFNFFLHNLAQLKFSNHDEGALLSFVPKTYSIHTDGRITKVEVLGFQKRYSPEKHYTYVIKIVRENQKVPSLMFRHFSEFVEFREKLVIMFPLVSWPQLPGKVVLGRSNVRTVARTRKVEIEKFLRDLLFKAPEISECDLVYTFFHPLLRDEQSADFKDEKKEKESEVRLISKPQGMVKLSVQHQKDSLQVMIMHVKNLSTGNDSLSTYVKVYLLPDPDKHTKQKTKVVKHSTHPTFNEVFQYRMSAEDVVSKTLQVTVWNHDTLKENQFIGAVYIRLRDLNMGAENVNWYTLGTLQMPSNHMMA